MGSPPRMRGKVGGLADDDAVGGITPAYAGKSGKALWNPPGAWDHPRVCGEKTPAVINRACVGGSPPRMRGKARDGLRESP